MTDKPKFKGLMLNADDCSRPALDTFIHFLQMSPNAHTINIEMKGDGKIYMFEADILKYMKPVYEPEKNNWQQQITEIVSNANRRFDAAIKKARNK